MPLPYLQDLRHCAGHDLDGPLAHTRPALQRLKAAKGKGEYAFLDQPDRTDDLAAIEAAAARLRKFGAIVLLGTGGSSLGARTLAALVDGGAGFWPKGTPRLVVAENVDPFGFGKMLDTLDPADTGLLAVSKSGGTGETLAQMHAILPWLEKAGPLSARACAITEPTDNALSRLAGRHAIPILEHPPTLGGRYSVLSIVGLLPAAILGLDIRALRAGAAMARDAALDDPATSLPAHGAALAAALVHKGKRTTVLCPYVDALAPFGQWFAQLWAESLGKGGEGTTPIRALGTVDQHSQLQLWLDGPADKLITIVARDSRDAGPRFAADMLADGALDWLAGRTMGDLLDVSWRATAETLARHGRPVRILTIRTLDETTLGALLMHFMLETVIAADLFGVEPYHQPAVEDGKKLARAYMKGMGAKADNG
ncbi:MAG: glucose-6-phosphate isomerase [Alphaproteobacteria bacterium]|nr:glucose-6-phosphate isomerase [Alphaproteobacteria bacterium]